jgi:hypothetical protein
MPKAQKSSTVRREPSTGLLVGPRSYGKDHWDEQLGEGYFDKYLADLVEDDIGNYKWRAKLMEQDAYDANMELACCFSYQRHARAALVNAGAPTKDPYAHLFHSGPLEPAAPVVIPPDVRAKLEGDIERAAVDLTAALVKLDEVRSEKGRLHNLAMLFEDDGSADESEDETPDDC